MATSPFGITFPASSTISPSVRVVERDLSFYDLASPGTSVLIFGFASKGPINVPVFINTKEQFRRVFGYPRLNDSPAVPYGIYAAENYLTVAGNLLFVRVGVTDPSDIDFAKTAYVTLPSAGKPATVRSYFGSASNPIPFGGEFNQIPISIGESKSLRIRVNGSPDGPLQLTVTWPSTVADVRYVTGNISLNGSRDSNGVVQVPGAPDRAITDGSFTVGQNNRHIVFTPTLSGTYSLVDILNKMVELEVKGGVPELVFSVVNFNTGLPVPGSGATQAEIDAYNEAYNGSIDNGRLEVVVNKLNGSASSIEFVSVAGDMANDIGFGLGRTSEAVESLDDRYPASSSIAAFDLSSAAGRNLTLNVIVNGTGDPTVDGIAQVINVSKLATGANDGTGPGTYFSSPGPYTASQVAQWINIGGDDRATIRGFHAIVGTNASGFAAEVAQERLVEERDRGFGNDANGVLYLKNVQDFSALPLSGTIYVRGRAFNYEGKVSGGSSPFVANVATGIPVGKSYGVDVTFGSPALISVGTAEVRINKADLYDIIHITDPGVKSAIDAAFGGFPYIVATSVHDNQAMRLDSNPYSAPLTPDTTASGGLMRAVNSLATLHLKGFKIPGVRNVANEPTYAAGGTAWVAGYKIKYTTAEALASIGRADGPDAPAIGFHAIHVSGPRTITINGIQHDSGRISSAVDVLEVGFPATIDAGDKVGPAGNDVFVYQAADDPQAVGGFRLYGVRRAAAVEVRTDGNTIFRNPNNPSDITLLVGDKVIANNGYRNGHIVLESDAIGADAVLYVRGDSTADTFLTLPNYATHRSQSPEGTVCLTRDDCDDYFYAVVRGSTLGGHPDGSFTITAESPGMDGNDTSVDVAVNPEDSTITLTVWHKGVNVESWSNLSKSPTTVDTEGKVVPNPFYLETYVRAVSDYIRIIDHTNTSQLPKPGSYTLGNSIIGSPVEAGIGSDGVPIAGDGTIDELRLANVVLGSEARGTGTWSAIDVDRYPVDIVTIPGIVTSDVVEGLIYFCDHLRRDCIAFVDVPYAMPAKEVNLWHNGRHPLNQIKLNSSFAAIFWPWIQYRDRTNSTTVWCPPSVFMPALHALNDAVNGPWYSVAGTTRGVISGDLGAIGIEYNPPLADRDSLYGKQNAVNAFIDTPVYGIYLTGQKTLQRRPSALDRINVRRMMLYIEKTIRQRAQVLLHEPLTNVIYSRFRQIADDVLLDVKNRQGIRRYVIKVDDEINTSESIERNELRARIGVVPVKAVEFIFIEFTVNRQDSFLEGSA